MTARSLSAVLLVAGTASLYVASPRSAHAELAPSPRVAVAELLSLNDSLLGYSGKLRARFLPPVDAIQLERALDAMRRDMPAVAAARPAVAALTVVSMVPFEAKVSGRMGLYRMGYWPGERSASRSASYDNPRGFIQVTQANQDLQLSEHFRLRDFVTKDQFTVWPKYVVLHESLIDKLELVIDELNAMGHPVHHVQVMSGFRHPFYNQQGVGRGGRADESRHQYGDASDIFVDNDRDGTMDDLDGDHRITVRDAEIIIAAVNRVESAHPELIGGMGRYHATHAHGPFVHIDVRGTPARWGGA